jgi:hypothetical protein
MLRTLGLLFVALLLLAGAGFGYWIHQDRQARAFVATSIPVIFKEWSADAVIRRAALPLKNPEFEAQTREFFQLFGSQLGPLHSAELPQGSLRFGHAAPELPASLIGEYSAEAKFREGNGQIDLTVIKEQGVWRIVKFGVSSPKLLEAMKNQKPAQSTGPRYDRGPPDEEGAILAAAEQVFAILDSENPGAAWNQASLPFQQAEPKRRFVAEMKRMREKTGHAQARKLQGVGFRFNRVDADPPGDYAIADYVSTYSRMQVQERLGFYRREGSWRLAGHAWNRVDPPRK